MCKVFFMESQNFPVNICMQLLGNAWKKHFNVVWLDKANSNNHTINCGAFRRKSTKQCANFVKRYKYTVHGILSHKRALKNRSAKDFHLICHSHIMNSQQKGGFDDKSKTVDEKKETNKQKEQKMPAEGFT